MNITFSIIIPTYNSDKVLPIALKSIINQNYKNFEILVIDGKSKDNTLAIAKSFNDQRIKIFSEGDKGIYDAMNKGIEKAKGEWLYFLGSDDELYDVDVLCNTYNFINRVKSQIVYGNVIIKGNCVWAKDGDIYDGAYNLEKLVNKNISHQALFYSTSFIKKNEIKFNLKYQTLSDWDFNLKCFSITNFSHFEQVIAVFNTGGASTILNGQTDLLFKEFLKNFLKYFNVSPFDKSINLLPEVFLKGLEMQKLKFIWKECFNKVNFKQSLLLKNFYNA
ncbi:glycosyltransferase [Pedobacter sp. SD-b]|uniref:Glycosyltransferase n=1 Tax=Pedobacter segetis TaxID=2793069 RepID=A0ABS1BGS2_9SPHI|nr:glycosyltransferase family 2 protein [Pedobacter segetis]MBK0382070.1 glycosyltransferase [Pedobacter segetis]